VLSVDPEKSLYSSVNSYKSLFSVTPQEQSTIISLEAQGSSPDLAYQRVASLIQIYQQRLNELRRTEADTREQFAQEELEKARSDLFQAQSALEKFRRSTGITGNGDNQTKGLIDTINSLKNSQAAVISEAEANETQARAAASRLRLSPQQAMDSLRLSEHKEYQAIRDKLSQVETSLAEMRGIYTDSSPQVQSLLLQRQELHRELTQQFVTAVPEGDVRSVDTTLGGPGGSKDSRMEMIANLVNTQNVAKGLQKQATEIQGQIEQLSAELHSISANQAQLADLQRQYEIAEGTYKGILAQIQQAKTNPFNVYPSVQTLDEPIINPKPIKPKRWLIIVGGVFASLFGSIALILYRETSNPLVSLKDLQQLELPLLVSISRLKNPAVEQNLSIDVDIDFQRLATAVSSLTLPNRQLMITSSTSGEGKTTVTLGLALGLVSLGYRVLVVDADLEQAELSRRLGYPQAPIGADSQQAPVPICPGLDLMPGPFTQQDRSSQFFARGNFEQSLSSLQNAREYDYVLVDTAPVSLSIETTLMSSTVRNVLFLVRPGISDRNSVIGSIEQLKQQGAQIKGLVVNGVETRTAGYRYEHHRELVEAEA
jgi:uncharacterized protein involved in exopolysaccharide biosynthesis/Mrp family chromosome partitioning ATPase